MINFAPRLDHGLEKDKPGIIWRWLGCCWWGTHEHAEATAPCAARCADAGPDEIAAVLAASGVWGAVHEPADSGPFNAHDLDGSPAILTDIALFQSVYASPPELALAGGMAGPGPVAFNISLAQARAPLPHARRSLGPLLWAASPVLWGLCTSRQSSHGWCMQAFSLTVLWLCRAAPSSHKVFWILVRHQLGSAARLNMQHAGVVTMSGCCAQAPTGAVFVNASVSSARRAAVYPGSAVFTPANWNVPKASGVSLTGSTVPHCTCATSFVSQQRSGGACCSVNHKYVNGIQCHLCLNCMHCWHLFVSILRMQPVQTAHRQARPDACSSYCLPSRCSGWTRACRHGR